ncbi:PcfK-like family protein [Dyadobacter sp. CY261]|uniref:PcfK-like family protein n=1 Tax=Dyadobacter sp. CY261 TaxID=2907203 RepID=UPI001F30AA4A|nr:PcfK-like family protein [Dyadobacter sp. CY261]MCF0074021.1 PcfK-like family protein [Dyadobacter sp. CY261]
MKGTDSFRKAISQHLDSLGSEDPLFAETLKKPGKNIEDCITYILNQVKNSGCNGFEDSEIYGMAVHYYDEEDIKPGHKINCKVVVNHTTELTAEDLDNAKQAAFEKILIEEKERLKKKSSSKSQPVKEKAVVVQQAMF